ncbi:MAG: hypothetical protein JW881_17695 [Spirochaetales bacterium]|nr:hypothetical protein [Spirochaetales bacterium]
MIITLSCLLSFVFPVALLFAVDNISLEEAIGDMRGLVEEKIAGSPGDDAKTIAVYRFTENGGRTMLGDYISSEVASRFSRTENARIKILSRKKMDDILAEHEFQFLDLTDAAKSVKIGKILNAEYIVTGDIFTAKDTVKLNILLIDIETAEIVIGNSYSIPVDADIAALIDAGSVEGSGTAGNGKPELPKPPVTPVYVFTDGFERFDESFWTKTSVNKELQLEAQDGKLVITGKFRKGRLNSINDVASKPFRVKSFAMEIGFRDPLRSSEAIVFSVENTGYPFFAGSAGLAMAVNFEKEYYKFSWFKDGEWHYKEEALKLDLLGDEDKTFHRLKLVFDEETKTAYGYLDDTLIDATGDFTFKRSEKLTVNLQMRESVSDTGKDVRVEFDDYKSSIAF